MEFKVFLLCFAFFVATTYAATVCKCGPDKKDTVSKYNYKVKTKDGDKEVDEDVEVDIEKQTETFHIPKMNSSNAGEVDVVFDFKKNLAMHRLSAAKSCFLSNGTENLPKPDDLVKLLDQQGTRGSSQGIKGANDKYEVVETVNDRSDLSDEMASLCAKLPIYRVKKTTSQRVKRWPCHTHCYWHCPCYGCGHWHCFVHC